MSKLLADRLALLRNQRGLSRQEVADGIEMIVHTYQKYEFNQSEPKLETLEKLADFYNVSVDYLLGRKTDVDWENVILVPRSDEEFLALYDKLPDQLKEALIVFLNATLEVQSRESEPLQQEPEEAQNETPEI